MDSDERSHIVALLQSSADCDRRVASKFPWWNWWERMRWNAKAERGDEIAQWLEDETDKRLRLWRESDLRKALFEQWDKGE